MAARFVGCVPFTDGVARPVYEDADGQFVFDGEEKIYGTWVLDGADEPVIVDRQSSADPVNIVAS